MRQRLIIELDRADAHYWRDFGGTASSSTYWRGATCPCATRKRCSECCGRWLRPFLTMLVFTIIFGRLAKFPSDGNVPYPLMVLVGMILWTLFSTSWTEAGSSLVRDASLITKGLLSRELSCPRRR